MENRAPVAEECDQISAQSLVERLVREHRRWRSQDFPLIAHLFDEIQHTDGAEPPCVAPLRKAFYRLYAEMEGHMTREEHVLFPAILDAQGVIPRNGQSFGSIQNPIAMMEQEHDWEAARLEKMRSIAQDYQLPENAHEKLRLLFRQLEALEASLHSTPFWKAASCSRRRWRPKKPTFPLPAERSLDRALKPRGDP
jgi:regulator of cell morphogenesis and NO signaling